MRTKILPLLLVAGMTFGGAAFAGTTATTTAATTKAATTMATTMATTKVAMTPGSTSGTIKSISSKHNYIVLSDGWKYHLAAGFSLKDFKVGEKVSVSYTLKGKKHEVTAMTAG